MHQEEEYGELPICSDQRLIFYFQSLGGTVEQLYSISLMGRRVGTEKGRRKARTTFTLTTTRIEFVNREEKGTLVGCCHKSSIWTFYASPSHKSTLTSKPSLCCRLFHFQHSSYIQPSKSRKLIIRNILY